MVAIGKLAGGIGSMLRRLIGEDIVVNERLSERSLAVKVDRGQLEQVMMNLTTNARDAMPEGGSLTIETHETDLDGWSMGEGLHLDAGRLAAISVIDTGDVRAVSAPGRGATFTVYLPLTEEVSVVAAETTYSAVTDENPSETILLVEDEPSVARNLSRVREMLDRD